MIGLSKIGIGKKIAAGYGAILVLAAISGISALVVLSQSRKVDNQVTDLYLPLLNKMEQMNSMVSNSRKLTNSWLYNPNVLDKGELVKLHEEQSVSLIGEIRSLLSAQEVDQNLDSLKIGLSMMEENLKLQKVVMQELVSLQDYDDAEKLFTMIPLFDDEIAPGLNAITNILTNEIKDLEAVTDQQISEKYASFDLLEGTIIVLTSSAIFLGIFLAIVITRNIMKTLGGEPAEVARLADLISQGKLNMQFQKAKYVGLYGNMKAMVERLKEIVTDVHSGADSITQASMQMSTSSQEMSTGASDQAASSEEVSASMEEMTANIQQNADNSQKGEEISVSAMHNVEEGRSAVDNTVSSMKQIADKVKVITEIARQTNILALNAAVEAARAGEAGKGFAVVAAEVRRLAENSQSSAVEIDELCQSSVVIAENAGQLFKDLVPNIGETVQLVQEINNSSREQNSGAEQVNGAIQQLNSITQQNAASSEEMAASAEELLSQADQLKSTVGYFDVGLQSKPKKEEKKQAKSEEVSANHFVSNKAVYGEGININLRDGVSDDEFESFK